MIFGKKRPRPTAAARLYDAAVTQSRSPDLYAGLGAPDTVEGRFELLTLHVILILERLRGEGPMATALSQALFDLYCRNLDGALREMGVGDLTVSRRMKALGGAFYGRAAAYRAAIADLPDPNELAALVGRTVMAGAATFDPRPLAAYLAQRQSDLANGSIQALLLGVAPWPAA
ncbi:MAG TPA: ubiquinol-cytochrome C chaperone family protein [Caulobacteraceae bacterium]|jgi:cytochrome b pre-mRNA-processing protein 3|nr:ubiquinol-cytochrome C chaperone family protein [Caulobacteraceae bacterium]